MPSRRSTSPSPPPQVPVTLTPGLRATALQKVFVGALSSSIKANSYDNFSSCFPTPARYCPTALEGVWKQLNTRLEEECRKDFDKILEERNLIEGLNQWDTLIEEARRRKNLAVEGENPGRALHTLNAEELHTAHIAPYLHQASQELDSKLQVTQQDNSQTMNKIRAQRAEIEQLLTELETVVKDVEGSVEAMDTSGGLQNLKDDVWSMEQDLSASHQRHI